jgi:hypothetical protein
MILGNILLIGIVVLWVLREPERSDPAPPNVTVQVAEFQRYRGTRTPLPTIIPLLAPRRGNPPTITPPPTFTPLATFTPVPVIEPFSQSVPHPIYVQASSPKTAIGASPTNQPTAAPPYPAVRLREPQNGQNVVGESATFEWQDPGLRQTGDHFELRLKHLGSPIWEESFQGAGVKLVLNIRDILGYGDYVWTIFVLDAQNQVVSQASEERKIAWQPKEVSEPSQGARGSPGSQGPQTPQIIKSPPIIK